MLYNSLGAWTSAGLAADSYQAFMEELETIDGDIEEALVEMTGKAKISLGLRRAAIAYYANHLVHNCRDKAEASVGGKALDGQIHQACPVGLQRTDGGCGAPGTLSMQY
jgi:hypothetical protein